ncbi:MAG: F0F1 ATP synthase subunit C [Solibacterales bacterium]|nr:F0F1 ATP synthase subunit C [Bryobacterales bacterium]|tara:strand:+ start:130326 stop:130646 length:321 start_codon:yes stop_codon:yes gene_type:complete
MKFSSKQPLFALLFVLAIFLAAPVAAFAQGGESGGLHYFGAAVGGGIVVVGAAIGIGRLTAAAVESIARQPQAARDIQSAFQLPLFLLEGVAVIAVVGCLLIILTK